MGIEEILKVDGRQISPEALEKVRLDLEQAYHRFYTGGYEGIESSIHGALQNAKDNPDLEVYVNLFGASMFIRINNQMNIAQEYLDRARVVAGANQLEGLFVNQFSLIERSFVQERQMRRRIAGLGEKTRITIEEEPVVERVVYIPPAPQDAMTESDYYFPPSRIGRGLGLAGLMLATIVGGAIFVGDKLGFIVPMEEEEVVVEEVEKGPVVLELSNGREITSGAVVGSPYERAMLDVIGFSEGTDWLAREWYGDLRGDRIMYAGEMFHGNAHPVETGEMDSSGITARGFTSTASMRYQFLYRTYLILQDRGHFADVSSTSQDNAAIDLFSMYGMDSYAIQWAHENDKLDWVLNSLSPEWSSLPTLSGDSFHEGQKAKKVEQLDEVFTTCLEGYL